MRKFIITFLSVLSFGAVQASGFPPNVEKNQKTIITLIEAGSDPTKAHPLEHHFYCYDPDSLKALMSRS